jgi:hypothetical protein
VILLGRWWAGGTGVEGDRLEEKGGKKERKTEFWNRKEKEESWYTKKRLISEVGWVKVGDQIKILYR